MRFQPSAVAIWYIPSSKVMMHRQRAVCGAYRKGARRDVCMRRPVPHYTLQRAVVFILLGERGSPKILC